MKVESSSISFSADRPAFIVFEGVNGAGKSTLLRSCSAFLTNSGRNVLETREPGEGEFGKKIREIVLGQTEQKLDPLTELFLFAADRTEHVARTIRPALEEGKVVLCDRYSYSTEAFQGYGRQLPLPLVQSINTAAIQNIVPDLVVLVDLDPLEGLKRTQSRQSESDSPSDPDSFEKEELDFHHRLRQGFLEMAERTPEPFLVLSGELSPEKLFEEIKPLLATLVAV